MTQGLILQGGLSKAPGDVAVLGQTFPARAEHRRAPAASASRRPAVRSLPAARGSPFCAEKSGMLPSACVFRQVSVGACG